MPHTRFGPGLSPEGEHMNTREYDVEVVTIRKIRVLAGSAQAAADVAKTLYDGRFTNICETNNVLQDLSEHGYKIGGKDKPDLPGAMLGIVASYEAPDGAIVKVTPDFVGGDRFSSVIKGWHVNFFGTNGSSSGSGRWTARQRSTDNRIGRQTALVPLLFPVQGMKMETLHNTDEQRKLFEKALENKDITHQTMILGEGLPELNQAAKQGREIWLQEHKRASSRGNRRCHRHAQAFHVKVAVVLFLILIFSLSPLFAGDYIAVSAGVPNLVNIEYARGVSEYSTAYLDFFYFYNIIEGKTGPGASLGLEYCLAEFNNGLLNSDSVSERLDAGFAFSVAFPAGANPNFMTEATLKYSINLDVKKDFSIAPFVKAFAGINWSNANSVAYLGGQMGVLVPVF